MSLEDPFAEIGIVESLSAPRAFSVLMGRGVSVAHRQARILFDSGSTTKGLSRYREALADCHPRLRPFLLLDYALKLRLCENAAGAYEAARDAVTEVNGLMFTDEYFLVLEDNRKLTEMRHVLEDPRMADVDQVSVIIMSLYYHRASGDRAKMQADLDRLIALDPANLNNRMMRAKVWFRDGRKADAAEEARFVVDRDPDWADALAIIAVDQAGRHGRAEARRLMDRALALQPASRFIQQLNRMLSRSGRLRGGGAAPTRRQPLALAAVVAHLVIMALILAARTLGN